MNSELCSSCLKTETSLQCQLCEAPVCKRCAGFLPTGSFSFRKKVAPELQHDRYCRDCYEQKIEPELQAYEEMMEQARNVYIFFKTQRRAPPVIRSIKETLRVELCEDRDETILRLAFLAAEQGFNAVLETDVVSKKIRNAGHEKTWWQGTGTPAQVDAARLERG